MFFDKIKILFDLDGLAFFQPHPLFPPLLSKERGTKRERYFVGAIHELPLLVIILT